MLPGVSVMMEDAVTITTGYPGPFLSGDIIEIQGADYLNARYEVIEVRSTLLTLWPASPWRLLRQWLWRSWLTLRLAIDDAWFELCDILDEAKADWRRTHEPS
jgi:hypothetical protein